MIKLDLDFLKSIDLDGLPDGEKQAMLDHIYQTLELRVGMRLAGQMTEPQLDEFEKFIDGNIDFARNYLNDKSPDWQGSEGYKTQLEKANKAGKGETAAVTDYAALKWLENNFPSYRQAIEEELNKLKTEIKSQAPEILSASQVAMGAVGEQETN